MQTIRDIKRKARRNLHDHMRVPAAYVLPGVAPVLLHVRDHTKFLANAIEGAVRSGNGQMVDRQEAAPSIVFMRDEVEMTGAVLLKNGIVSIERGEAYRLQNAEAPDDITVKWYVTQITRQDELDGLPLPEDV